MNKMKCCLNCTLERFFPICIAGGDMPCIAYYIYTNVFPLKVFETEDNAKLLSETKFSNYKFNRKQMGSARGCVTSKSGVGLPSPDSEGRWWR